MGDIVNTVNKAVEETAKTLEVGMGAINDELPSFIKKTLRDIILNKIIDIWQEDDFLNIKTKLEDLKNYTDKDVFFKFKLGECINYIRCMSSLEKPALFNLN